MRCARVQERLLLYIENELASHEWQRIARHLEDCRACQAARTAMLETHERVDGALRTAACAPPALDARVMAAVRRIPVGRRPWVALWASSGRSRRLAVSAAALCLVVAAYLAGRWSARRASLPPAAVKEMEQITLSLALLGQDHLEYLANPQPAEIPGPGAQDVALGLTPLLKFPVAVVDLQPEGARLLGGRKCQVHGTPIAFLLYDWRGERVSLYQMDGRRIALPPLREVTFRGRQFLTAEADGLSYVAWRSGAMNFVMVSAAAPERLLGLASAASGVQTHANVLAPTGA
jgi:anti-sigma factor RsiW